LSSVLDASAVLAWLQDEPGADVVEERLTAGASCGAANWSEVAQKVVARGGVWPVARGLLHSYELQVEPVTVDDAETAATQWRPGEGLSLADRLCLALSRRLGVDAVTADRSWATTDGVLQIR
jgi:PIN domain nuclease of toxin-antitoxin system